MSQETERAIANEILSYFVPAWISYSMEHCAYRSGDAHCKDPRDIDRRWCKAHCELRQICLDALGGGTVVNFEVNY